MDELPHCEVCHGQVYRRLAPGRDGGADWVGELWHLDMSFLDAADPGHDPALTGAPGRIALID